MLPTKEKPEPAKHPAIKSNLTSILQREHISRKDFFRNLAGRLLTAAVVAAEGQKNDSLVNRLLKAKDRLNRRRMK